MNLRKFGIYQGDISRFRIVRGSEGVVSVDVRKAQEAMKQAMLVRENSRANDGERKKFVYSHVAQ